MQYIKRSLETAFLQANQNFPVLLITGPRQTGKSTLLKKQQAPSSKTFNNLKPLLF